MTPYGLSLGGQFLVVVSSTQEWKLTCELSLFLVWQRHMLVLHSCPYVRLVLMTTILVMHVIEGKALQYVVLQCLQYVVLRCHAKDIFVVCGSMLLHIQKY